MIFSLFLFNGCSSKPSMLKLAEHSTAVGEIATYEMLPQWSEDDFSAAHAAFVAGCGSGARATILDAVCNEALAAEDARHFFETAFVPFQLSDLNGESTGLMTGYYEPLLYGSRIKTERYRYPLYKRPDDLVTVDLGRLYPELRTKRLRGRIVGNRLVPYDSRSEINSVDINASAVCYVDDCVDRFFLQVQGSGRVLIDNNETIFVGYADENGHPYASIGKELIRRNEATHDEMSLQFIRQWLQNNPDEGEALLEHNPSFVFFYERTKAASGSLGVELTPLRSLAVDRRYIPLGLPVYYSAEDPVNNTPMARLGFAHDVGGAIKGAVRADLFWGYGKEAERKAGQMKSPLKLWVLVPKALLKANEGTMSP